VALPLALPAALPRPDIVMCCVGTEDSFERVDGFRQCVNNWVNGGVFEPNNRLGEASQCRFMFLSVSRCSNLFKQLFAVDSAPFNNVISTLLDILSESVHDDGFGTCCIQVSAFTKTSTARFSTPCPEKAQFMARANQEQKSFLNA
jgi:hypothetical protein